MSDEVTQEELDDAIIEDTVHCCVCGFGFLCGGNDGVFLDGAEVEFTDGCNGAFCIECAEAISKQYRAALDDMGICEHGVDSGDWCEPCNREYKEAARRFDRNDNQ